MKTHFTNIKSLVQVRDAKIELVKGKDMAILPCIENAYLSIEHDQIVDFGEMNTFNSNTDDKIIDLSGKLVLPTWVDSHTHLVFAGTRETEFTDRIKGLSYQEIAERGGGILNSAEKLEHANEDELYDQALERLNQLIALGTGAIEIKSGYGLQHDAELKMLRIIQRLKENAPIPIKATYLAAHALPQNYKNKKTEYVTSIIEKTLPQVAEQNLAEYIDVFCEKGYFDLNDTDRILKSAKSYGLKPKVHVNQFNAFGGVKVSVDNNALSVDHLEVLTEEDITHLKNAETLPVALPGCSFFLNIPYTPGRELIKNGLPLTLASDYNPGSTPNGNMNFILALACIKMKLLPEEAINAMTLNAAAAVELSHKVGSITKGKLANFIITKPISSYNYLPYSYGENCIEEVWINGKKFNYEPH